MAAQQAAQDVFAEISKEQPHVLHLHDLAGHQEQDAYRGARHPKDIATSITSTTQCQALCWAHLSLPQSQEVPTALWADVSDTSPVICHSLPLNMVLLDKRSLDGSITTWSIHPPDLHLTHDQEGNTPP